MMSLQPVRHIASVLGRCQRHSFASYMTCKSSSLRNRMLYQHVRLFSSKDDDTKKSLDLLIQLQDNIVGLTSSDPKLKPTISIEKTLLNKELRGLSSVWKQLGMFLEGRDAEVEDLVAFIEKNLHKCSITALCKLLPSYLEVFKHESRQFIFVVDEGMRRMPMLTLNEAMLFVSTLYECSSEKVDSKYFAMCQEILKGKLTERTTPSQLMYGMALMRKFQMSELNETFDMLMTKQIDNAKTKHLTDMMYIHTCEKRRNITFLKLAIPKLCQSDFKEYSLNEMGNLFFACSGLNIQSTNLFEKMSTHTINLLADLTFTNQGDISSILRSCGNLGWRNDTLLGEVSKLINWKKNVTRSAHQIITMCHLGYPRVEECVCLYNNSLAAEKINLKKENPILWLSYVHATAARRVASQSDIVETLNPDFFKPLITDNKENVDNILIMLMNLQGCLEVDFNIKDQPLLEANDWPSSIMMNRGKNSVSNQLENSLRHITFDYVGPHLDKYGHLIDFEVRYRDRLDAHSGQVQQPVRIRVLEFKEMVRNGSGCSTTGRTDMAIRHLKSQPTPIVIIPYDKWYSGALSLQNAISLENQMKAALNYSNAESAQDDESQPKTKEAELEIDSTKAEPAKKDESQPKTEEAESDLAINSTKAESAR